MSDYMNKLTTKQLKELEEDLNKIYGETTKEVLKRIRRALIDIERATTEEDKQKAIKKLNGLEDLIKRIMEDIHNTNLESVKKINKQIIDTFIENQEYGAFLVEKNTGEQLGWQLYSRDAIKGIMTGESNPFYKLALDEFKDKDIIYRALRRELIQSIMLGEGIPKIAKRIQNVINRSRYDSIRIARTETTKAENAGRLDAFKQAKEQGLNIKKKWISTLDNRTRASHIHINGEVVDLDKNFSNGLDHPGGNGKASEVINCRCTMGTEFVGFKKTKKEQELDDQIEAMNNEIKERNITYKQWKKERDENARNKNRK